MLRYCTTAAALGAGWFVVLLVPGMTRQWGCFVFLTLWATLLWAPTLVFGGLANLHDTLSLYVMGLTATAISFYVVIPYGLACQYVMKSALDAME